MICVICKTREVDSLNWGNGKFVSSKDLVVCFQCRGKYKPGCVPDEQYPRYWKAFSKKWRRENTKRK